MGHYDINDAEKVLLIKNWLGREGMQFINTLTKENNKHVKTLMDYLIP